MIEHGPKRFRGEELRQQVLDTALRLFSEHGYFNTSIHDIRREAGVSIGAIYHHFENKEHLAKSLYDSLLASVDGAISRAIAQHQSCFAQSRAVIELLFDLTMREPRMMQFILLAKHREYLPGEAPICSSGPFVRMRQVLERGMVNGEVRRLEPWVAATAMFGGALRMMNLQLDGALDKPLPYYLAQVVECGWKGVRA